MPFSQPDSSRLCDRGYEFIYMPCAFRRTALKARKKAASITAASRLKRFSLEVQSDLRRHSAWRDIVRPAERRKKVIERVLVGQVDGGQLRAHLVLVAMEHIVMSHGEIEKMAWCDARRVVVIVLRAGSGNPQQTGGELGGGARAGQGNSWSCAHTVATEAGLEFLVGGEASGGQIYDAAGVGERGRARNQSAVVTPVEP